MAHRPNASEAATFRIDLRSSALPDPSVNGCGSGVFESRHASGRCRSHH